MPAVYDNLARFYDTFFYPLERLGLSKLRRDVISLLPSDGAVLEIGCGSGANFACYRNWETAISTDISLEMLKIARNKKRQNVLVNCNAEILPFASSTFDGAFATLVFCSIPDPMAAFRELQRVLKPGALFIMLEHVRPPGSLGRIFDFINTATVRLIDDHFNRNTAGTALHSGFEILEIRQKLAGIINLIVCRNPSPPKGGL